MKFKFDFKRMASAVLSLAMVFSVLILPETVSADTTKDGNLIANGDFEAGSITGFAANDNITVVSSSQTDGIAIDSKNAYFSDGNELIKEISLPSGEYTWQFEVKFKSNGGYAVVFDAYTGLKSGAAYGSGTSFGETANISMVKLSDGAASAAYASNGGGNGHRVNVGSGTFGYRITEKFTLTEAKTVYLAIRAGAGDYLYVDNMSLYKKIELPTKLVNGDFESGTDGWSVTEGKTAATFKTVSAVQDSKHKDINITNNAGYFVTGGTDTWLYQGVKLAAGEYTWKFHIDLYGTHNMVGAYKSKSGIGTAAALITADTFTTVKDDGTVSSAFKNDNSKYIFSGGQNNWHYTITYKFTLAEETEVYFAIRGNGGGCQYIDNMTLVYPQKSAAVGFERDSDLDKVSFVSSSESLTATTVIDSTYAHSGTKSLKSVAVADENNTASAGNYQGGRFALPIAVQKNKFYKTTFWLRIDGDNATDGVAFRISNSKNVAAQANSIISSNSGPNPSAEFTLNPANTEWTMKTVYNSGWAGFIKIMNTNTASTGDWVEVSVKFASNDLEEVYLEFANFFRKGTVFYLDDVVTEEITSLADDSLSYDFEKGGTGELKYGAGDSNSLSSTTKRTDAEKHSGSYSLVSTAVADSTVNGSAYQGGTLAVPLKGLEKNKNYRLSFWTKISGTNATDMVAFRVSNDIPATYRNSLISSNSEIFYTTNLTVSDSSYKLGLISKPGSGWAGYIGLPNTNKGSAWIKITVDFCAGDNDNVYLQFANFFKKGTTFYLDDIEYNEIDSLRVPPVAEYDDENIVYYVTFEEDESVPMNANGTPATHYSKTTKYAHSGKYSVVWDSNHNDGWNYLYYTDKVGNLCYDPVLEPSTAYRFSLWVYSVGPKFASTAFAYQYPGMQQTSVKTQAGKWEQIVIDFVTEEDQTSFPFKICSAFMRFGDTYQYIDDIKLEKLTCSITAVDTSDNYCEAFFNKVKNGNFEGELANTVWDTDALNVKRIKSSADQGAYYGHLSGNASLTVPLDLRSVYQYKFMYSYRASSASSLKIGILDDEGNELKLMSGIDGNISGLLSPTVTDGKWHRAGYTFLTPANGRVYLRIEGTGLDIDLDEIAVYMSRLTYTEDPNTYKETVKKSDDTVVSVPDAVIDTDIDIDTDIGLDTEIPDGDGNETDNKDNSQSTNKVNTPEKETNNYLWIILIAGLAVALAAGAAICIIIIKKRSKKQ